MWEEDRATAASVGHPVVLDSRTRSGLVGRGAVGRGLAGRDAVSGGGAREWRGGDTGGGLAGKSGLPSGASQARRLGWDSPWCGSVMFSQRQVILSVERRRVCRAVVTASSRPVLLAASAKATGSPLLGGFSCWAVAPTSRLPFLHPASALGLCFLSLQRFPSPCPVRPAGTTCLLLVLSNEAAVCTGLSVLPVLPRLPYRCLEVR